MNGCSKMSLSIAAASLVPGVEGLRFSSPAGGFIKSRTVDAESETAGTAVILKLAAR